MVSARRGDERGASGKAAGPPTAPFVWIFQTPRRALALGTRDLLTGSSRTASLSRWSRPLSCWDLSADFVAPLIETLPRIRLLAYFQLVVEALKEDRVPDGYLDYLRLKWGFR